MANIKKRKLGDKISSGIFQLKGDEEKDQVFSIISDDIFQYNYHYDNIYNQLGKFMCNSEFDEDGKVVSQSDCCKMFKCQERVVIPVIHYEGSRKKYRKMEEGTIKILSISAFKYNQLLKELDAEGVDIADCDVDILLKCEDSKKQKISFSVISGETALWRESEDLSSLVEKSLDNLEDDIIASLPKEYTEEEFLKQLKLAQEADEAPAGVEVDEDETPKKKKSIPTKSKKKSKDNDEDDLDDEFENDDLDTEEDEDEDEKPKKKKSKKVEEPEEDEDEDYEEDEKPKKKKSKKVEEPEEDEDEEDEKPKKKKSKKVEEPEEDEDEDEKPKKKKSKVIEKDYDEDDEDFSDLDDLDEEDEDEDNEE